MSMDTNKEAPGIDRERIPETITFRTADRMTYGALGYDGNELMAFISGSTQVFFLNKMFPNLPQKC